MGPADMRQQHICDETCMIGLGESLSDTLYQKED